MKAFSIKIGKKEVTVPVEPDGMTTIHLFDHNEDGRLYVGSAKHHDYHKKVWCDFVPVDADEVLSFHFTDTENVTAPEKILKREDKLLPKSRLEQFMIMRDDLEKKGLI